MLFPGILRSEGGWIRPASSCPGSHFPVQAHPVLYCAKDDPATDAHVEEEGVRVIARADVSSAGLHEEGAAPVEAPQGGPAVGVRHLLQDQRHVGHLGQLERVW